VASPARRPLVLIVLADKDPYDLLALQAALVAPDREVLVLADGDNIVTLAGSRSPDVVVVGSSLGHMGGFAVARELKMLSDTGAITEPKVLILLEREADAWLAEWSRADAYLTPPVDPADVDRAVRELVGEPVV
jgi:DNA-binding response OmpR family regulator